MGWVIGPAHARDALPAQIVDYGRQRVIMVASTALASH
jgi:hypothetical protein